MEKEGKILNIDFKLLHKEVLKELLKLEKDYSKLKKEYKKLEKEYNKILSNWKEAIKFVSTFDIDRFKTDLKYSKDFLKIFNIFMEKK